MKLNRTYLFKLTKSKEYNVCVVLLKLFMASLRTMHVCDMERRVKFIANILRISGNLLSLHIC